MTHEALFHQRLVWVAGGEREEVDSLADRTLRFVDGHALHGVGQVLISSLLLLLLPSSLLFLGFLGHLLVDRSGLDELNDLRQTWRMNE